MGLFLQQILMLILEHMDTLVEQEIILLAWAVIGLVVVKFKSPWYLLTSSPLIIYLNVNLEQVIN